MVYSLRKDSWRPETQLDAPVNGHQRSKDCVLQRMAGHIGVDTHGAHFTLKKLMVSSEIICPICPPQGNVDICQNSFLSLQTGVKCQWCAWHVSGCSYPMLSFPEIIVNGLVLSLVFILSGYRRGVWDSWAQHLYMSRTCGHSGIEYPLLATFQKMCIIGHKSDVWSHSLM